MPTLTLKDRFLQLKEERFALKAFREHKLIARDMVYLLSCILPTQKIDHDAETSISYTTIELPAITLPARHISGSLV